MSAKHSAYVWEASPYEGKNLIIHLALADVANDTYEGRLWMSQPALARKARTSTVTVAKALQRMVAEGFLELLTPGGSGRGKVAQYRFLMPKTPSCFGLSPEEETPSCFGKNPKFGPPLPLTQINSTTTPTPIAADLCEYLADAISTYLGDPSKRPRSDSRAWLTSMRLLMERGPAGRAKPDPVSPDRVRRCIDFLFTELASPEGRNGFCWASVIRSPGSLREKWDQIVDAGKRKRESVKDPRRRGGTLRSLQQDYNEGRLELNAAHQ